MSNFSRGKINKQRQIIKIHPKHGEHPDFNKYTNKSFFFFFILNTSHTKSLINRGLSLCHPSLQSINQSINSVTESYLCSYSAPPASSASTSHFHSPAAHRKKKKKQINPSIETRKGKRVFQLMEAIQVPLNSCVISLTSAWFFQLLSWYVEIDKVQN